MKGITLSSTMGPGVTLSVEKSGDLVDRDEINKWSNSPRKFMEWLRSVTLGLHSN